MTPLDIGPMILDLAGIPAYLGFQGQIPPQLRSTTDDPSRPNLSTIQSLAFEDSVLASEWRLIRQQNGPYQRHDDDRVDPWALNGVRRSHPAVLACLKATLKTFRANQLGYWDWQELVNISFPPREKLDPAACAAFRIHAALPWFVRESQSSATQIINSL